MTKERRNLLTENLIRVIVLAIINFILLQVMSNISKSPYWARVIAMVLLDVGLTLIYEVIKQMLPKKSTLNYTELDKLDDSEFEGVVGLGDDEKSDKD